MRILWGATQNCQLSYIGVQCCSWVLMVFSLLALCFVDGKVYIYLGLPSRHFFLMFGQKTPFQEVQLETAFFFPKRRKVWFWCWLQPPGSLIPCLHLPSRLLSSSAPKKFLQYLALFVFYPDVKSTSFSGAIASWKPSSTSIKKRCPVKRRNFPTKRRKNPTKRRIFFRGDFEGFQNN